jgi:hypothetical protein
MKPVFELGSVDVRYATISLSGDGRREQAVLKAFAERYNGNDFYLQLPSKGPRSVSGKRHNFNLVSFSALQAINTYASKIKCYRYLFLIDKEHVIAVRDFPQTIKKKLVGFSQVVVSTLGPQAFLVRCRLGLRDIIVHAVVCGEQKCVEENIAELVFLELGVRVNPRKPDIDGVLRQRRLSLYELVKNAQLQNLKQSFSDLTAAFVSIERINHTLP